MGRRSTGLRNRYRNGKSTYALARKHGSRDQYGEYRNGVVVKPDIIGGHLLVAIDQDALKGKK